ncbi:hypothetical protein H2203_005648 [Taxawa tesnikishii (nom. ined.)]|nr:hypothetical protein H2203_005648 [Dothideales sp. JES 119]
MASDLDALANLHNDPGRWNTRDLGNNLRKNANDDEMPKDPVLSDPEEEEERHEEDTEETAPKKRSGCGCQISRGYKALWREIDQLPSKMLDPDIANLMKKVLRAIDEDDEVFCRHHVPPAEKYDYRAVMESVFPGAYDQFQKDGTVNINVFDWLFKEDLMKDMLEELAMYKHHLRLPTVIRQDVLYYLAYVCLRPDHNQQLVSYPYYCKYATGASKTEFRHLDNHPDCLLASDGANMIQGTMSLVDETKDNCTVLIKGIHQHFEEWWHDVQERGGDKTSSGAVIRIDNKIWSKEDEEKYGLQWEEVPCKAGEARITLPYLLHGSNGGLVEKRVTVFPWYMAVKEDLSTLEINAGANDWTALALSHLKLTSPPSTPSGHPQMYGTIAYAFPTAVPCIMDSAVSQAIVGRTTWADPRTLTERAILFGTDDEKRKKFIDECHADAARKFRVCFRATMDAEARYYPMKSYDRYKQGYGEVSSDDELVESVSSEESSGKDTGGKGEGEGSAMNISDENDSSESPRGGASDMDTD